MKKLLYYLTAMVAISMVSCTKSEIEQEAESVEHKKVCQMVFNGDVAGFDNITLKSSSPTKATTSSWNNGDKVYITFYNGTTKVLGEATYTDANGWSVSYDGSLSSGTSQKCEVRYFVNATFSSASLVSLNSSTEIYEALNGTYDYNGTNITVTATMTPKTGRIKFNGASSSVIFITGIETYTTFAPANNAFSTTKAIIKATVASSGSTPYIYGKFAESDCSIGVVGSNFAFTRICSSSTFKTGDSGYMAIPSESSHNNWKSGLYVKANGVEFKMIPVTGYTGGFFLLAETETTEKLYKTIIGSASTSTSDVPMITYYSNFSSFIDKLNVATFLSFSFPTNGEWLYAAKGGNKSQGYIYCGSNNPGDVAWYASNCSALQNVKRKAPNELGFYDMSGNAAEFVLYTGSLSDADRFASRYGGSYSSKESNIKSTSFDNTTGSYISGGLRLKLVCK